MEAIRVQQILKVAFEKSQTCKSDSILHILNMIACSRNETSSLVNYSLKEKSLPIVFYFVSSKVRFGEKKLQD